MHYLEWNTFIGQFLFNADKAGQSVYVCLTNDQLIALGRQHMSLANLTDDEIWDDFRRSVCRFVRNQNLVGGLEDCFHNGRAKANLSFGGYSTQYPPYLGLLVVAVLPLTDSFDNLNGNNYYDRATAYLKTNKLPLIQRGDLNQNRNWLPAWEHLESWTKKQNGNWGLFDAGRYTSNNYRYVGRVFAQCLIAPKSRSLLPATFANADWVPKQYRTYDNYLELLERVQTELGVREWVLRAVRQKDELGQSVVSQLQQAYAGWTGRNDRRKEQANASIISKSDNETERGFTYLRLFLTFKNPADNHDKLELAYRLKTDNVYPDSLSFNNERCQEERYGWSGVIALHFREGLRVEDTVNKWRARLPDNAIRLFERGNMHGLSSKCWVEVDALSKVHEMVLMCDELTADDVHEWGKHFPAGRFKEWHPGEDFLPNSELANYRFFWFRQPTQPLNEQFVIPTQKTIKLKGGLLLSARTFYAECLPVVYVEHGNGSETVEVHYNDRSVLQLQQDAENPNLYSFDAEAIRLQQAFHIKIRGELTSTDFAYSFRQSLPDTSTATSLPLRDRWRVRTAANVETQTCSGIQVTGIDTRRQESYLSAFFPGRRPQNTYPVIRQNPAVAGDALLAYLTARQIGKAEDFNQAFSAYRDQYNLRIDTSKKPVHRWALEAYDWLSFLDFDYTQGRFVVLPTALIPLPCQRGRAALLIGGRTPALLATLRQEAANYDVQMSFNAQQESDWLLPSIITFVSSDEQTLNGCEPIRQMAEAVGIPYLYQTLPQWAMLEVTGKLEEFKQNFLREPDERTPTLGWTERLFNPNTLEFELPGIDTIDKMLALVRYDLHTWQQRHLLWINGNAYAVERDWGRYLLLHFLNRQVIYKSSISRAVAVPVTLPLPRLLNRAFTLTTGKLAPLRKLTINGQTRTYRVYENSGLLADNYFRSLGQHVQPTSSL